MRSRLERIREELTGERPGRLEAIEEILTSFEVTLEALRAAEDELRAADAALVEARRDLDQGRREFLAMLDLAEDAYVVTDSMGMVARGNAASARLLGVPHAFMEGKILLGSIADSDRQRLREALADFQKGALARAWTASLRPASPGERPVSVDISVRRGPEGQGSGLLLWHITRREGAGTRGNEEDATATQATYTEDDGGLSAGALRELVDSIAAVVWQADLESGRLEFVSSGAERLLGFPSDAWIGGAPYWIDLVHVEDRSMVAALRSRQRETANETEMEYRLVGADGRYVWVREVSRVDTVAGGRSVLRGLLFNISKRKRVERHLYHTKSQAESQVRELNYLQDVCLRLAEPLDLEEVFAEVIGTVTALLGSGMGSISLLDNERGVLRVAAAQGPGEFPSLVGLENPLGTTPCGAAVAERRSVTVEDTDTMTEYAASREMATRHGFRAVFNTPLFNLAGDVLGVLTTYFPEPFHLADRQLELIELYARHAGQIIDNARRLGEIRAADRKKEEFLAQVGHELRNPLTALVSALNLLANSGDDDNGRQTAFEVLHRQTQNLARLVDNMIDVSRIGRGLVKLSLESTDPVACVTSAIDSVRARLESLGHTLLVDIPGDQLRVDADPGRLAQAFGNVLANAVKYTAPGGLIRVTINGEENEVVVSVADNGIGIAPEMLPRVFDRFNHGETSGAAGRVGLGIGLTLVQKLVALHGGSVLVASGGLGKGSEVTIRLPQARGASASGPRSTGSSRGTADEIRTTGRKVLLVDDDPDATAILVRLLRAWGHQVSAARNGAEAIGAVRREEPEVVLLDVGLPDTSGFELIARIREVSCRSLVVLAVTGFARPEDRLRALELGFDRHFAKPLDLDALRDCVATAEPLPT